MIRTIFDRSFLRPQGNCNSPGSGSQKLHRDSSPWGDAGTPESRRAKAINVNFSTREILAENGGPEVWPGSHHDPMDPDPAAPRRLEAPPLQLEVPAGGVAFRDHRMWHRGVPNSSTAMRQMVSLNYDAPERFSENKSKFKNGQRTQTYSEVRSTQVASVACDVPALLSTRGSDSSTQMDQSSHFDNDGLRSQAEIPVEDRRLVFAVDCADAFAAPSRYGVDRNVRFCEGPVDHFSGIFGPGPLFSPCLAFVRSMLPGRSTFRLKLGFSGRRREGAF